MRKEHMVLEDIRTCDFVDGTMPDRSGRMSASNNGHDHFPNPFRAMNSICHVLARKRATAFWCHHTFVSFMVLNSRGSSGYGLRESTATSVPAFGSSNAP